MEENKLNIRFDDKGLVPAIAVDAFTNEVLMQAYVNAEALSLTLSSGRAHYFSRSRNCIWLKGETSGHFQRVVEVKTDCDRDSVLYRVEQTGPACHTGARSCFFSTIKSFKQVASLDVLQRDAQTIDARALCPEQGSYTNYLLDKGREKICKKIGEEATETVIAAMKGDNAELAGELADLYYHTLVLLKDRGMTLGDVLQVLQERSENVRKREY